MYSVACKHPLYTQEHNTTIIKILGIFKNKRVIKILNVSEYSTVYLHTLELWLKLQFIQLNKKYTISCYIGVQNIFVDSE